MHLTVQITFQMYSKVFPMLPKDFKWENTSALYRASVGKLNLEIFFLHIL